jgi:general secretion pathway protein G
MRARGFTLIELAVVLAIIAVLAGILTPMVTSYLDQSRASRAQADLKTLADAIKLYQRDTGQWPVYASSTDYPSTIGGGGGHALIGGSSGTPPGETATWNVGTALASSSLESYLNGNFTGVSTSNAFPKKGFRGPYLGSNLDSDPWGSKYLLTASNLAGSSYHAFVISAGPDGKLDTTLNQNATDQFSTGNDDIVAVIK